ncbi:hypothetical protein RFI_26676 [Reticulomyxa filosa]|uniref:Uncharacterized protein n=1 Tax=Reticulomyxa filosa TaxID=46433 RepID=X6MAK6_RETFI|nr:hypothetical protein RFI_26676 [Reticulomyxa filosa]|eukprot:ETO10701.1 hypothetical protein RFI_26676 [Reticulomyxa filosa]
MFATTTTFYSFYRKYSKFFFPIPEAYFIIGFSIIPWIVKCLFQNCKPADVVFSNQTTQTQPFKVHRLKYTVTRIHMICKSDAVKEEEAMQNERATNEDNGVDLKTNVSDEHREGAEEMTEPGSPMTRPQGQQPAMAFAKQQLASVVVSIAIAVNGNPNSSGRLASKRDNANATASAAASNIFAATVAIDVVAKGSGREARSSSVHAQAKDARPKDDSRAKQQDDKRSEQYAFHLAMQMNVTKGGLTSTTAIYTSTSGSKHDDDNGNNNDNDDINVFIPSNIVSSSHNVREEPAAKADDNDNAASVDENKMYKHAEQDMPGYGAPKLGKGSDPIAETPANDNHISNNSNNNNNNSRRAVNPPVLSQEPPLVSNQEDQICRGNHNEEEEENNDDKEQKRDCGTTISEMGCIDTHPPLPASY